MWSDEVRGSLDSIILNVTFNIQNIWYMISWLVFFFTTLILYYCCWSTEVWLTTPLMWRTNNISCLRVSPNFSWVFHSRNGWC